MVFLNCAVESYGDVNGNRMIRPKTDSAPESSVFEIVEFRHRSWCWEISSTCILPVYIILVLLLNHYSGNVVICGIWLVSIDSPKMIDRGRSKSRQFCRTFTYLRYDPQALSGLRLLSLFLSSVGKISRLYSGKST